MRRREGLVQVDVQNVDAEISRPRDAHHRVEVRPIHVDQRAARVKDFSDLCDLTFEDTQRVRIGHHDGSDVVVHDLLQMDEVNSPVLA